MLDRCEIFTLKKTCLYFEGENGFILIKCLFFCMGEILWEYLSAPSNIHIYTYLKTTTASSKWSQSGLMLRGSGNLRNHCLMHAYRHIPDASDTVQS